jgi:D-aspartate ligase
MAQRNGDPLALVMGDVDMVRALGIAGIPSAFFGVANESARFSSHVRVSLPWIDPWERQDQLVAALLDFARSQTEAPILFPQTDAALLLASRHRGRLAEGMRMMLADRDLIDQLVGKRRFQALAARHDLPVPPAQHLRPAPGDPPPALDVPYPVVVKPLTRIPAWAALAGSGKALRVPGRDDLAALWPRLTKLRTEFLAQQLVRGPESRIESFHVYVDVRGRSWASSPAARSAPFHATMGTAWPSRSSRCRM